MPSSHSQQPPAKPKGIFGRKKISVGFSLSKPKNLMNVDSKNQSNESVNSTGNDGSSKAESAADQNSSNNSAATNITPVITTITAIASASTSDRKENSSPVTTNNSDKVNYISDNNKTVICKNVTVDGSSGNSKLDSSVQESYKLSGNHNGSFSAASRITSNESNTASSTSSGEASSFITTSSSSSSSSSSLHRQRLHRQITSTREMKTSCVKSDLTELKSSLSEMKNLSFNSKFTKSIENILDGRAENVVISEDNNAAAASGTGASGAAVPSGEPLITYPESPTPNATTNIVTFPNQSDAVATVVSSRKSSIAAEELPPSCCVSPSASVTSEMKFEQRRLSSASKTKLITEQFKSKSEESSRNEMELKRLHSCDQFAYQEQNSAVTNNLISEKTIDARHIQKTGAQQQRQTSITSSSVGGMFNKEKVITHHSSNFSSSKGFSTSVSHMQQFTSNTNAFLENEIKNAIQASRVDAISGYLAENFDDLNELVTNASHSEVEKAIQKYTTSVKQIAQSLNESKVKANEIPDVLNKMSEMMTKAWFIPTHGHELGNSLCNALRECGGLSFLISNCDSENDDVKFSSAKLLEQCLTTENRAYVVEHGLEKVVQVACICTKNASSSDHSRVRTGILEHLFKHSEGTCEDVIRLGGLDAVLYDCRKNDIETLRHCASALANLSLYGGADNQQAMIKRKVPVWLFPLAFHNDDNIKYYACLAIAVLVANKEIEADVLKSGTLNLVEPFVTSHNPSEFAKSNLSHAHGQSKNWLRRLVPVLSSKREEARNLAAFHFCMEAGIKKSQGNTEVFREIGAVESLKKVASCPNAIASKFAAQALRLMGEDVPHKLIQQVPLWSAEDVQEWVIQIGFPEYAAQFNESRVDGDMLLKMKEENLRDDIKITNGLKRIRFTRELQNLKKMADYSSRDSDNLNDFMQSIGPEYTIYTYSMLNAGVDKDSIKCLTQEQLQLECGITNSIHRLRILEAIKAKSCLNSSLQQDSDKPLDVFISYRRSNGSQLASLLKVHLQIRNFTVFIDVEKLEAGKFDNNLLRSIKQAKNFVLVLTPEALDRCVNDSECKDWVHREIVAALQSDCNIIPIIDSNFAWPEQEALPEDMRAICHFNGLPWVHDYQEAVIEKLEKFIRGETGFSRNNMGGCDTYSSPHGIRTIKNDTSLSQSPPSYHKIQCGKDNEIKEDGKN
ncbi:NAD(+) hydrolase sarm1 isoform X2 [Planococcus citri]|uniref:NAD(+) hydrolase sarm1 isoform X2 n=1 Tax=Planococcus citri TaxID=170843 RepID=UPI0031F913BC